MSRNRRRRYQEGITSPNQPRPATTKAHSDNHGPQTNDEAVAALGEIVAAAQAA